MEYFKRFVRNPVVGGLVAITIALTSLTGCINVREYLRNQNIEYRTRLANGEATNTNDFDEGRGGPEPISNEEWKDSYARWNVECAEARANGEDDSVCYRPYIVGGFVAGAVAGVGLAGVAGSSGGTLSQTGAIGSNVGYGAMIP